MSVGTYGMANNRRARGFHDGIARRQIGSIYMTYKLNYV